MRARRSHRAKAGEVIGWIGFLLLACPLSTAQSLLTNVHVGSNPMAVAVNTTTNKIYVVNQESNNVTVVDGVTYNTVTVATGTGPDAIAINPLTNKIYVANCNSGSVTVINGQTNGTSTVAAGTCPYAVVANAATNKIYVSNFNSSNVTVIDGGTNRTSNVNVGLYPYALAVNPITNQIFVADYGSNQVTIIDGATNLTTAIAVGSYPRAIAINQFTNQIYVANYGSNNVSVVDGTTYWVTNIGVGTEPVAVAVDPVLNEIVVANIADGTTTIINGATLATTTIAVGTSPSAVDLDPVTAKAYFANDVYRGTVTMLDEVSGSTTIISTDLLTTAVAANPISNNVYAVNTYGDSLSVIAGGASNPLQFVPVPPCRVVDTRQPQGPYGGPFLSGRSSRNFAISLGGCNLPTAAAAYSLNVTVVPHTGTLGYLTIWPAAEAQPLVSTLNSLDGRVKANAAIVPAGAGGAVTVYVTDATDVILDINGYFESPGAQILEFYPLPPCRVFDTRRQNGVLGGPYLSGGLERDFPIMESNCEIPAKALAYSMNFTVTPVSGKPLGYLTVWPSGTPQPVVSTLNNPTATTLANAAIVPAGVDGEIAVYPDQDTELIGDINGYFAAPGAGGLSLYPLSPCRVIDTRSVGGAFSGQRSPPVDVAASACGLPGTAQNYVFNATVVPVGSLGYLTLWAYGDPMPGVSTLNATDGIIASNMAIIGNVDGETDAYAYGTTQLILDIASYFAP